jgi:hypothetical protein
LIDLEGKLAPSCVDVLRFVEQHIRVGGYVEIEEQRQVDHVVEVDAVGSLVAGFQQLDGPIR